MSEAGAPANLTGRRVIVTGAAGLTGRTLCCELLDKGATVVANARRDPGLPAHENLSLIAADLRDLPALDGPFDAAVHCAATSPGPDVSDADIERDNFEGGHALLERLAETGCGRVVYLSSLSVHGEITDRVVTPETPIRADDAYGRSKHAFEEALRAEAGKTPAVAIRLPGIVGPGAARNWLTRVKVAALRGEQIEIFNPDAPYNNIVHVDDLVAFVVMLTADQLGGFSALPVGSGGMTTVRQAVKTLVEATGSASPIVVRETDKVSFTIDNRAAERLGYRPGEIRDVVARYGRDV